MKFLKLKRRPIKGGVIVPRLPATVKLLLLWELGRGEVGPKLEELARVAGVVQ